MTKYISTSSVSMEQHFMKKPENERNYLLREISSATNTRVQQLTELMESIRSDQVHIKALCKFQVLSV